jgi:hypothetical protein
MRSAKQRYRRRVTTESRARPRRYCFYDDEVAEAEAQGISHRYVSNTEPCDESAAR